MAVERDYSGHRLGLKGQLNQDAYLNQGGGGTTKVFAG